MEIENAAAKKYSSSFPFINIQPNHNENEVKDE